MKNTILFCIITLFFAACSTREDDTILGNESVLTRSYVTYSGDVEGVSVLIFGFKNNDYYFQNSITSGWVGNKNSANLDFGSYKFLFYKAEGTETTLLPASFNNSVKPEDIMWKAKENTDPAKIGYVLPVNEIWLPVTPEMAAQPYEIKGNDLIENTLKRAISQVDLYLLRGGLVDGEYSPIIYTGEKNIMENIAEIRMDISGVGNLLTYKGTTGNSKTYYSATKETSISNDGFAYFEGPFVFPAEDPEELAEIAIQLIPKEGSIFEGLEMKTTVQGKLERNKKLSIRLWLQPELEEIKITVDVDTSDIFSLNDGDEGIWE